LRCRPGFGLPGLLLSGCHSVYRGRSGFSARRRRHVPSAESAGIARACHRATRLQLRFHRGRVSVGEGFTGLWLATRGRAEGSRAAAPGRLREAATRVCEGVMSDGGDPAFDLRPHACHAFTIANPGEWPAFRSSRASTRWLRILRQFSRTVTPAIVASEVTQLPAAGGETRWPVTCLARAGGTGSATGQRHGSAVRRW
jgi:hypothetical protein